MQQQYVNAGTVKSLILSLESAAPPQLPPLSPPASSGPSAAVAKRVKELEAQMDEFVKREMYNEAAELQRIIEAVLAGKPEPPVPQLPSTQPVLDSSVANTIKSLEMRIQDLVSQQRYPEANKLTQQINSLRAPHIKALEAQMQQATASGRHEEASQ